LNCHESTEGSSRREADVAFDGELRVNVKAQQFAAELQILAQQDGNSRLAWFQIGDQCRASLYEAAALGIVELKRSGVSSVED
jgi:hypothetical protein